MVGGGDDGSGGGGDAGGGGLGMGSTAFTVVTSTPARSEEAASVVLVNDVSVSLTSAGLSVLISTLMITEPDVTVTVTSATLAFNCFATLLAIDAFLSSV